MEFIKNCPICNRDVKFKNEVTLATSQRRNSPCRSCIMKKEDLNDSLEVKCLKCNRVKIYSNKYNANFARVRNRCASCSRANANKELWKDKEFRDRKSKATTKRLKEYWSDSEKRKELGRRTSIRNIERWKDDEYRDQMIVNLLIQQKRYGKSHAGHYKGTFFRSSLELNFLMQIDNMGKKWISCENSEYAIRYMYKDKMHTYYPDFKVDNVVYEIKPSKNFNDPIVKAKEAAAITWCKERNLEYKMLDPGKINSQDLNKLKENPNITFLKL